MKKEFNPNIINTINRLSKIIKEEEEFIDSQTKKIFEEIVIEKKKEKIEFDVKKFNNQEKVIQKKLILLAVQLTTGTTKGIEKINLEDMVNLCNKNIGNKYIQPTKGVEIGIKNKRIYIKKKGAVKS